MANVKTTPDEWRIAREFFESGLSLSQIVEKTGISKSQLSKVSNREGWLKETEKQQLIQKAVELKLAKETMDEIAVSVHNSLVEERTKHIALITNATHVNVNRMMRRFDPKSKEYQSSMSVMDHKLVQSTIKDARESLLGKEQPTTTAVQVNNNITEVTHRVIHVNQ